MKLACDEGYALIKTIAGDAVIAQFGDGDLFKNYCFEELFNLCHRLGSARSRGGDTAPLRWASLRSAAVITQAQRQAG